MEQNGSYERYEGGLRKAEAPRPRAAPEPLMDFSIRVPPPKWGRWRDSQSQDHLVRATCCGRRPPALRRKLRQSSVDRLSGLRFSVQFSVRRVL